MSKNYHSNDRNKIIAYMKKNQIVRAKELRQLGVSPVSVADALRDGVIERRSRGLYISAYTDPGLHFEFAEIAKLYPNNPICLNSALFFFGVSVVVPRGIWVAISASGWKPRLPKPDLNPVRFREPYFSGDREVHEVNGVDVVVYSLEKTLADAFRNPKFVRPPIAIEALRTSLEERKSTPSDIRMIAEKYGVYKVMRPFLDALTTYA